MPLNQYDDLLAGDEADQNPYDAVLRQATDAQTVALKQSMTAAVRTTPDRQVETQRAGVPPDISERAFRPIQRQQQVDSNPYDDIIKQTPDLAKWLETPTNAAVSRDDLEPLGSLEWLLKAPALAWQRGQASVELAQLRAKSLFGDLTADEHQRIDTLKSQMAAGGALGTEGHWFRGAVTGAAEMLPMLWGSTLQGAKYAAAGAATVGAAGGAVGALGAGVGAVPGAITGATAGAQAGFLYGNAKYAFELSAGQALDEFSGFKDELGQPIDPKIARAAALGVGAVNGLLQTVGARALLETIPGADRLVGKGAQLTVAAALQSPTVRSALLGAVKDYATTVPLEAALMVGQRAAQILGGEAAKTAAGLVSDQEIAHRTPEDIAADLHETGVSALQSFALLSLPGPLMHAGKGFIQAQDAAHNATFFKALGEGVTQSKTVQRAPEAAQALLAQATKDGPIPTVYAPIDTWTAYWQSKGLDPAAVAKQVTGDSQAYDRATRTGEDLAIPTANYAVQLAGTEHNAFFANELRLAPEQMNAREAESFSKQVATADSSHENEAPQPATDAIRDKITTQLASAGVERATADSYATLYEHAFGTLGARAGVDPEALYSRYGLTVSRPELATEARAGESQFAQSPAVDSDAFRAWFGNSMMKDDAGAPVVAYHGTASDFESFDLSKAGTNAASKRERALFFSVDPDTANHYAEMAGLGGQGKADAGATLRDALGIDTEHGSRVLPVHLRMENPAVSTRTYYNSAEMAKEIAAAKKAGHDGIIFPNMSYKGEAGTVAVFSPEQVKSAIGNRGTFDASGNILHQGERGVIKFGADRQFNIELLKGADLSTFLHESGHFFVEVMQDLAKEPGADSIRADVEALRAFTGNKGEAFTTEQHEQIARGFEKYLMEGKAPSAELRGVFAKFRAWLTGVYRSLKGLNVELTPEVRGVFDRLLASDDAIEQARTEGDIRPLFTDAKSAGMSEAAFEQYRSTVADASEKTREELQTKILRDVQREQTAQYKAEREGVRTQVASEVGEQPVYRALTAIRKGTRPDGTPLVEGREPEPLRLAKADLAGYGPDVLKTLRRLDAYRVDGGVHPDIAAELTGYSSGDELVKALAGAEPMKAAIERETDARMVAKHGDMLIDGSLATKAEEAVNGEHRQTVVRAELKALTAGMVKGTIPPAAVINHAAETRIAATRVRDLRPGQFLMAAKRASQKAFDLLATNADRAGAVQAKQQELINLALYREATKAQDVVASTVDYLRSFDTASKRERIGKAGADYLEQIDGIRDRFDLSTVTLKTLDRRAALAKWAAGQEAATGLPVNLPDELLNEARRINYKDLPFEELQGVRDGVRMIEHLATLKNKLLKAQGSRDLAASAAEAVTSIAEHSKGPKNTGLEVRLPGSATTRNIGTFFASHVKLASFVREMDGFKDGGAMWDRVSRPLNEAADAEAVRTEQATKALHGIFDEAYHGEETSLYHKTFVPAINDSLSKMARLMVALNAGNDGNRQRLRDGYHWSDDQIRAITDTLDARDVTFVNDVWAHINSYWPDIEAKERRVTGVAPEKVAAVPFSGAGGQFTGGYFPLKYEHELSARASANLEGSFAEGVQKAAYARATTQRGHTEARVEHVSEPVRLDFGVITEHVSQVIHDLTHHETLLDVSRILAHKDVQDAIYQHYGAETYDQIKGAIRDVAFGNTPAPGWYKTLNAIRAKTVTATLGWNAVTSLLHTLQISRGMARVDPVSVLKGLGRWAVSARNAENSVGWIEQQSDMMRLRWKTQQRELNEVRNQVGLDRGKVSAAMHDLLAKAGVDPGHMPAIADSYFYAIRRIVQFAEIPTWLGAYDKAMTESGGDGARAVALANQAVIDSMGSGQIKDLAAVQRAQNARVFTTFYDYHNAVYQQVREIVKKDATYGRKMVDASLMLFVPVALTLGLNSLTARKDDKRTWLARAAEGGLDYGLGMFAGARELEGAFTRADWSGPAGLKFIPTARNFLYQGGTAVGKVTRGEPLGDTPTSLLRATNDAGGALFGYPANQVDRTVRGLHAVMDGKADLSAVVFGPPKGVH